MSKKKPRKVVAQMMVVVPFSPEDVHPVAAVTFEAALDSVDDACVFRNVDPTKDALPKALWKVN